MEEFLRSDTAKKKGIQNAPSFEAVAHMEELIRDLLDPLRAAYGMPIRITSGFRCPELNKAVKGSDTSVHMKGWAADTQVGGSFSKYRDFVVSWVRSNNIAFGQILIEKNAKGERWLHIAIRNNAGEQRRQIKVMEV